MLTELDGMDRSARDYGLSEIWRVFLTNTIHQSIVASSDSAPTSVRGALVRDRPGEWTALQTCIPVALFLHFPMKNSSRPWSITTLTYKDEVSSHRQGL